MERPLEDPFDQGDALIAHWLHQAPAEVMEDWCRQVRMAHWLEERYRE